MRNHWHQPLMSSAKAFSTNSTARTANQRDTTAALHHNLVPFQSSTSREVLQYFSCNTPILHMKYCAMTWGLAYFPCHLKSQDNPVQKHEGKSLIKKHRHAIAFTKLFNTFAGIVQLTDSKDLLSKEITGRMSEMNYPKEIIWNLSGIGFYKPTPDSSALR